MVGQRNTFTIRDLNFYYGTSRALSQINMDIDPRQVTALIGPSGCGKSTFLRCLNRMNDTISGTRLEGQVILEGQDIYAEEMDLAQLRQKVGMVFQKPTPFPMSIFEYIAFALRLHENLSKPELKKRVIESLQKAVLWDEVKDKLHAAGTHLSGGQQQRLCIARTIAIQPDILLLDEPTSSLDPISTTSVEELILTLKQDFTILLVTHNLKQAQRGVVN